MLIKQISIFVENKAGRLAEITEIIAKKNINIRALSIADTTNFGILRIIVDEPYKVEKLLKENEMTVSVTSVLSVYVEDRPGELAKILRILADKNIAVEYMYDIVCRDLSDKAYVVFRIEKEEEAAALLKASGYKGLELNQQ